MRSFMIVLLIAAGIAFMTNPTEEDFEYNINSNIKKQMNVTNSGLMSWLTDKLTQASVKMVTRREDFKLFSIYHIDLPGTKNDQKYLGIYKTFIPLSGIGSLAAR